MRPEQARQLVGHIAEMVYDEGSLEKAQEVLDPGENFDAYDAAFVAAGLTSQRPLQLDEIRPQIEAKPKDPVLWRQYLETAFDDEDLADQVAYRLANQEEVDFEPADQLVRLQHEVAETESPVNPDLPRYPRGFPEATGPDPGHRRLRRNPRQDPGIRAPAAVGGSGGRPRCRRKRSGFWTVSRTCSEKNFRTILSRFSIFNEEGVIWSSEPKGRIHDMLMWVVRIRGTRRFFELDRLRHGTKVIPRAAPWVSFTPEDITGAPRGNREGYLFLDTNKPDVDEIEQRPTCLAHELAHALMRRSTRGA